MVVSDEELGFNCPESKKGERTMMTFEEFKDFISEDTEDKKFFTEEKMYAEYLENGYFSYTTEYGLFKETY